MKRNLLIIALAFALLFSFAACSCGKNNSSSDTKGVTEKGTIDSTDDVISQQESLEDGEVKLVKDKDKLCYVSDTATMVYYYEGNEITGYEMYVDYGSEEAAGYAVQGLEESNEAGDESLGIESITQDGTYVIIKYDKSQYEGLTVKDVKEQYEDFKNLATPTESK